MQKYTKVCKSMQKYAKVNTYIKETCKIMHMYTTVCKCLQNNAKVQGYLLG